MDCFSNNLSDFFLNQVLKSEYKKFIIILEERLVDDQANIFFVIFSTALYVVLCYSIFLISLLPCFVHTCFKLLMAAAVSALANCSLCVFKFRVSLPDFLVTFLLLFSVLFCTNPFFISSLSFECIFLYKKKSTLIWFLWWP